MSNTQQKQQDMVSTASKDLEDLITLAIKKVGGRKENDLCRYLPMTSGGYMHHFTLKKMKLRVPEKLTEMIKTFITNSDKPATVPPKQRAARGSRKRKDQIVLTRQEIDRFLHLAREKGDKDLIRKLMPKKDLKTLKRDLISSIRRSEVDHELWNSYLEAIIQTSTIQ